MALPNGTFKEWPFSYKPVYNSLLLPRVGQHILYGWTGGGRADISDYIDYTALGDVRLVRALWSPNEFQILVKQRSTKGYFIFNGAF